MGNSHIHRIQWIDCAKTMAMTAVVVDHCYGILYTNIGVLWLSAYSVPLFVLLSGISAWNSSSVKAQVTGGGGGGVLYTGPLLFFAVLFSAETDLPVFDFLVPLL